MTRTQWIFPSGMRAAGSSCLPSAASGCRRLVAACGVAVLAGSGIAHAGAGATAGTADVVVRTASGGFILGYDVDADGTHGLHAEAVAGPGGTSTVAVETFDVAMGGITDVVVQKSETKTMRGRHSTHPADRS